MPRFRLAPRRLLIALTLAAVGLPIGVGVAWVVWRRASYQQLATRHERLMLSNRSMVYHYKTLANDYEIEARKFQEEVARLQKSPPKPVADRDPTHRIYDAEVTPESRRQMAIARANFYRKDVAFRGLLGEWHAVLAQKYQEATRHPWANVVPDPPEPRPTP